MAGSQQIDKLIRKNLLIKARRFKSTIFELMLPLVLFGLLAYMRQEYNKTIEYVGPRRFGQESVFPLTRRLLSFAGDFMDTTLGNSDSGDYASVFPVPMLCGLTVGNETVGLLESSLSVTVQGKMLAENLLQLDPNATAERVGSALRKLQECMDGEEFAGTVAMARDELLNWTAPFEHSVRHMDGELGELLSELRAAPGDVLSREDAKALVRSRMNNWVNETCSLRGPLFEKWNKSEVARLLTRSRTALNASADWLEASADWLEADMPEWLDWLDNSSTLGDCLNQSANLGEVMTCFNETLSLCMDQLPEFPHGNHSELRHCISEGGNLEACFNFTMRLPEMFIELDGEALRQCLHEGGDLEALAGCFNVTSVDLPSFARLAQEFVMWAEERDGVFNVSDLLSWANVSIGGLDLSPFPQWVDDSRGMLSEFVQWLDNSSMNLTLDDALLEFRGWLNRSDCSMANATMRLEGLLQQWLEDGNSTALKSELVPLFDEFLAEWNMTEWNLTHWFHDKKDKDGNHSKAHSMELVPMLEDLLSLFNLSQKLNQSMNHSRKYGMNLSWLNYSIGGMNLSYWFNSSVHAFNNHSMLKDIDWFQEWIMEALHQLDEQGEAKNADMMEVLSLLVSAAFVDMSSWSVTSMQDLVKMADESWPQILGWNFSQQIALVDSSLRYISHFVEPDSGLATFLQMLPDRHEDPDHLVEITNGMLPFNGGGKPHLTLGREGEDGPLQRMLDMIRDGQSADVFEGGLEALLNKDYGYEEGPWDKAVEKEGGSGAWGMEEGSWNMSAWHSFFRDEILNKGEHGGHDSNRHGGHHGVNDSRSDHNKSHSMWKLFDDLMNASKALAGGPNESRDMREKLQEFLNSTNLSEILSTEINISKALHGSFNLSGLIRGNFNFSDLLGGNITSMFGHNYSDKMEEALKAARRTMRLMEDMDGAMGGVNELLPMMFPMDESNFTLRGLVDEIRHVVHELDRSPEEVEKEVLPKWTDLWHEECESMNVSEVSDIFTSIAVGPLRSLAANNHTNCSMGDSLHHHMDNLSKMDMKHFNESLKGLQDRILGINATRVEKMIREVLTIAQSHVTVDVNLQQARLINASGALDELFCSKMSKVQEEMDYTRGRRGRGGGGSGGSTGGSESGGENGGSRADDDEDDREETTQGADYITNELLRRKFLIAPWKGEVKELYELLMVEIAVTAFNTELGEADDYPLLKPLLDNPLLRGFASQAVDVFVKDRLVTFETERELETYAMDYPDDVFAAIVFRSTDENGNFGQEEMDIKYAVRLHAQLLPSTSRILRSTSYTMFGGVGRPIYYYLDFGFAYLQDSMGRAVARLRAKRAALAEARRLDGGYSYGGSGGGAYGGHSHEHGRGHSSAGHGAAERDDEARPVSGDEESLGQADGGNGPWGRSQPSEVSLNIQAQEKTQPIRRVALGTEQFPIPLVKLDVFIYFIQYMLPMFMILGWIYAVSLLVKEIVYEKQERLREVMRIQGLRTWVYWTSWLAFAMAQLSLLVLVMTALLSGGGVLTHSNPVLIFLFFWVYSLTVVSMAMLISACFQRAKVACVCAGVAYYAAYLPFYILQRFDETLGFSLKCVLCLMGPTALGGGMGIIAKWELVEEGLQWSNMGLAVPVTNTGSMPKDGFALTHVLMMMLIDSAIYQVLAWYIEKVFPGELGLPQPWYFLFQRSYWRPTFDAQVNMGTNGGNPEKNDNKRLECYEAPSDELTVTVQIRRLMKRFPGGKVALKGITLDMHSGTILGLLGHNGAGKSTTMSILTGLYPPTEGDVLVNGVSVRKDSSGVRNQLGVCPQHNALYEVLTVKEHLDLFCNLKGVPRRQVKDEVDSLLRQTGLEPKRDAPSRALSGGMKRKLSIGIALAGGSKVIALDEPTAGVDANSRRDIWHLLAAHKPGRAILLSTHFMDEADVLSDRIAIIAEGELTAIGSSMTLKKRFADRYLLTVVAADGADTNQLFYAVRAEVPEAKYVGSRGREYSYALPSTARPKFAKLFGQWQDEGVRGNLGVETYGLSASTMEEVFLQASSMHEEGLRGAVRNAQASEQPSDDASTASPESDSRSSPAAVHEAAEDGSRPASAANTSQTPPEPLTPPETNSPPPEVNTTEKKEDDVQVVDVDAEGVEKEHSEYTDMVEPPPSSPQCMVGALENVGTPRETPKAKAQHQANDKEVPVIVPAEPKKGKAAEHAPPPVDFGTLMSGFALGCQQFRARMGTRALSARRDRKAWASQLLLPASFVLLALAIAAILEVREEEPPLKLSTDMFIGAVSGSRTSSLARHEIPYTNGHGGGFANRVEAGFESAVGSGDELLEITGTNHGSDGTQVLQSYLMNNTRELRSKTYTAFSIASASETANVTLWFDNRAQHAIPAMLAYTDDARFHMLGYSDTKTEIWSHPLPKTQQVISEELTSDNQAFTDLTVAVTVLLAMGFIPASFLVYLVHEKSTNAKHQQLLSGVSPITFWLSSYCWDFINFLAPVAFVFMLFLIFQLDAYSGRNAPAILLLLLMYGACMTPLMYCIEPFFTTPSTAYVTLIVTNIFTGTVSVMSISVLQLYQNTLPGLKVIADILEAVYPWLLPNYCLGRGFVEIAANHYIASAGSALGLCDEVANFIEGGCTVDPLSWNVAGRFIFNLFVMSGVWLLLRLLIEWRFFTRFFCPQNLQTTGPKSEKQDEGVLFEAGRVESLFKDPSAQSHGEASLLISNLSKSFAPFRLFGRCSRRAPQVTHSVRGISVAVAGGECFGLLGVNGAGKTTTMRMITGDIEVGRGDVRLSGWSVKTHRDQARRHLGYCPQFDALPDLLTAREALSFYARVRGVRANKVRAVVDSTIARMCLEAHQSRLCHQLSGGNRRKLSTAIALIGEPDVVLLDEPSTGVDVGARRFLWDVLGSIRQHGHALVLTSHSMDECEVLCTRLTIMASGEMKCLGSPLQLKTKYGGGYTLAVKAQASRSDNENSDPRTRIRAFMAELPDARLAEENVGLFRYRIGSEKKEKDVPLADVFGRLESAMAPGGPLANCVLDYTISQTSLEEVFLYFSQM